MSTFIDGNLDASRAYFLLRQQDAVQRGLTDVWPQPRWIKFKEQGDFVLIMAWMNRACAERFYTDCQPTRVIGHCDRACHGDEAAAHYAQTDEQAIANPGTVIECDEPDPNGGTVKVRKLAYWVDRDGVTGWAVYGEVIE